MNSKVSIIILNWNGWKDTIECLESLYQITYPNYDIIVVDNGSKDDSVKKIKEYCEGGTKVESKFFECDPANKPIEIIDYTREEAETGGGKEKEIEILPSNRKLIIIKNEKNYGFAEGNDIGMRYALKQNTNFVLLLNNDTVVDSNFLSELVRVGKSNSTCGILGPKIYFYHEPNVIWSAGGKVNFWIGYQNEIGKWEKDEGQYDNLSVRNDMTGAAMLIKRELIETIGLLDPAFFLGVEHTDFCIRAHRTGFKVIYVPNAKVWHKVAVSINRSISDPDSFRKGMSARGFLGVNNKIKLFRKHSRMPPFFVPVVLSIIVAFPLSVIRFLLIRKDVSFVLKYGINYFKQVALYLWLKWRGKF